MPSQNAVLTATKVNAIVKAAKPGRYGDGNNLYLKLNLNGSPSWVYRYTFDGRRIEMGLGSLNVVSLANARKARDQQKAIRHEEHDPILFRRQQRLQQKQQRDKNQRENVSFQQCAEALIETKSPEWKNKKHAQQWRNTLRDYAYPLIGSTKVGLIDQEAVLSCLKPIWQSKTETAMRVRQRIEAVLDYAKAKHYRGGDNAASWRGNLDIVLPNPNKVKKEKHHPALPHAQLPAFIEKLTQMDGIAAIALRFTILTAARTGDVLNARWEEIDFARSVWARPDTKSGKSHRYALSKDAIRLLNALPSVSEFIFPGNKKMAPLSNVAMLQLLKRMGYGHITVHGFRTTFRDWVAEKTRFPGRVAEIQLAHQIKDKSERAYQRSDLIEKRVQMMNAYADYGLSPSGRVVRLNA